MPSKHGQHCFKAIVLHLLQKQEWSAADGTFKVHKSKLELAKEQAAAARSCLTIWTGFAVILHLHASFCQTMICSVSGPNTSDCIAAMNNQNDVFEG